MWRWTETFAAYPVHRHQQCHFPAGFFRHLRVREPLPAYHPKREGGEIRPESVARQLPQLSFPIGNSTGDNPNEEEEKTSSSPAFFIYLDWDHYNTEQTPPPSGQMTGTFQQRLAGGNLEGDVYRDYAFRMIWISATPGTVRHRRGSITPTSQIPSTGFQTLVRGRLAFPPHKRRGGH